MAFAASPPLRIHAPISRVRPGTRPVARAFPRDKWEATVAFLIIGYFLFNRTFAYLGVPPLHLFIGEIVLGCFLLFRQHDGLNTWVRGLARSEAAHDCSWAILIFICYGIFETARGVALGYSLTTCLENLAFNYYALYLILGWWLGRRNPGLLRDLTVSLAWFNGIYGTLYLIYFSHSLLLLPGTGDPVTLFGQPWGAAVSILGLMCFERRLQRVAIPLALNAFVMLGLEVRAEWIAFLVGLFAYAYLTKQVKRVITGIAIVCALLAVGYVADIRLPGAIGRGGVISTREIVARAIAPFDESRAQFITGNAKMYQQTAAWRTTWWKAIWASVHSDTETAAIGHGYGYPIVDLVPYLKGRYWLRTPHSVFFYALGYGGWFAVLTLLALEAAMVRLLWRSFVITGQPFGLVVWAAVTAWIFFDSAFESPFRGIPFFLLTGIAMGPALGRKRFA